MSVYLIAFANSNDYVVQSGSNAAYADSREGTGTISSVTAASTAQVGQTFNGNYFDFQVFLEFDLISWPSTLPAFELSLNQQTAPTSLGDTLEVWEYAWSGTGTGNFRAGSVLGSLTAFGSVAFPGSTGTFSVTSATTTISPGAYKLVLASQRQRLNTAPSAAERGIINTADAVGTTSDPYVKAILGTTPLWEWVGISNVSEVTTTAHALTEPAGVAQGDLLVAVISSRIASTTAITLPSGGEWTLVTEQKNNNTATTTSATPSGMMAYCVRGASAPNLTFTHPTAPSVAIGRIVAYRNVDSSSPKDTQTSFTTATNVTSVSGTGLTTTQDDDLIVAACCGGQEAAWSTFAAATDPTTSSGTGSGATADPAPNTWQERADSNTTTGADTSLAIFDAVKTAAGVTGNLTATASLGAAHVVVAGAFKLVSAAAGSAPPDGWWRPFETTAARTLLPAALIASGLVWCPQPIAASPSNEVTIDKWQQPLSKAVPVARAIQGDSFVPFNTAQTVAAVRDTAWQPPLSVAPQTARAVHTQPVFVPQAFAQYPLGWHQALGIAPPVAKAQPGSSSVPFNTAQTNTATIDKWQVPLSVPAPVAKAQQGSAFVPFDTAQTNTSTIDKWQQPFVAAVRITGPVHTQPSFVVAPFEVPRGWHAPLSVATPTTKARLSDQSFPFYPAVAATMEWQQPLSAAPAVAKVRAADQPFVVYPVAAAVDNTVTLDKWQQPLSVAVPVAKARTGDAFVPFNTVQIVPGLVTYDKYQQPLSVAPPVTRAVHTTVAFVPLPFPQYPLGWHQPLSKAAPVAKAPFVDVPFVARDTQFTQNTVDIGRWQQPLGTAPASARPIAAQPTFVVVPFEVPKGWHQPLSVSVRAPTPARSALVYAPYEPAVVVGTGIDGIAWLNSLGVPIPPVVYSLSPFTGWVPTILTTVESPPIEVTPSANNDPAGIKSATWKPRKAKAYRSYRFLRDEEIQELTGAEIREAARDLREDVRKDPLADEVAKEAAALERMAAVLADFERLEASVAELTRAIEYAAEQKAKAEAEAQQEQDDDDAATLLLS